MNSIWAILRKESRAYFNSFTPYALAAFFAMVNGVFFLLGSLQDGSLRNLFPTMSLILLFVLPFLTMRLFAEEEASGTMELLVTAPVRDWEIVVGKFLAALLVLAFMLGITLWFAFILFRFENPDPGPIFSGYLSQLLLGSVVISIGMLVSASTKSQLVAGAVTFAVLLLLFLLEQFSNIVTPLHDVFGEVTLGGRSQDLWQGVIASKDLIFFLSMTAVMLTMATLVLQSRRWR